MTLLDKLQAHKGGLLQLKPPLYWYGSRSYDNNPVRDPRQDLKAGDHVRFEVRGVIASRQSGGIIEDQDGNDHELVQYAIKDFINGKTYYVGYDKIINVTWSRK